MAIKVSSRTDISPFHVMEVMRAAADREARGEPVLHLEVGQPSSRAPMQARIAAIRAIENDVLGYTSAVGIRELRERISEHYLAWYKTDIDPDRVVLTMGASGAFTLAFLACFEVGDRVVVPSPGYPCYRNTLKALGIEVVDLQVGPETRFQPSSSMLDDLGSIDGLVIASPSNPTGTMLLPDELQSLISWCRSHDVRLISDEIYHGITFGLSASSAISQWDQAVVVNSFSKYFSMTGWRLGWLILPENLISPVERLAQNAYIAAPSISQYAALGAFDSLDELENNIASYARNRKMLIEGLPLLGITKLAPADGAFYVYADVSAFTTDSQKLAASWLEDFSIATTPGIDFDLQNGHKYIRFSFAGSAEDIKETLRRLNTWAQQEQV
jgi:aspartate/methionine/tyrosine aminotransferase|tara:strand:+ start:1431 stop:2588 length:1158 start_codon:yes stop_codon:yes gene_type:complete